MSGSQTKGAMPLRAVSRNQHKFAETSTESLSPDWLIWKTFVPENPMTTKMLHLRIEQPLVVTLIPDPTTQSNRIYRPPSLRTVRLAIWLLKIMVLPIAVTTGLLYLLLLYLLKNTELLEAQQHHPDSGAIEESGSAKPLKGQISFTTLPRAFPSDVELIASSRAGHIVVSVGLHNEITVWNLKTQTHTSIDATHLLLRAASSSHASPTLTTVTVEENGEHFAVGTGTGIIAVWKIDKTSIWPLPHLSLENSSAAVADLQFGNSIARLDSNSKLKSFSEPDSPDSDFEDLIVLLATFENGVAAKWSINEFATVSYISPNQNIPVSNVSLVRVAPENQVLVAFSFTDGSMELVETGDTLPIILCGYHIQPGTQGDFVSGVHACRSELNGATRLIIATATRSGAVSLWDGTTGECISVLQEASGRVTQLRVSPVKSQTCHYCGQLPLESVSIAFSVDYVVRFFKLYLKDQTRRCSCTRTRLKHMPSSDHLGRRSRSNSATSAQIGSPRILRARLATAFETTAFPVSGHGVHSRRASDKDIGRRSSDLLPVPLVGEDHDGGAPAPSPCDGASTPTTHSPPPSFWRNAIVAPVTETTCERGGWDVFGRKYVGLRRRPRPQGNVHSGPKSTLKGTGSSHGLTRATLERWELWMFDPVSSQISSSILTALTLKLPENENVPQTPTSTNSFAGSVSRLPFTRVSPLHITASLALAGFGNTIGVFHFTNC